MNSNLGIGSIAVVGAVLAIGSFSLVHATTKPLNPGTVHAPTAHKPPVAASITVECPSGKSYDLSVDRGRCAIDRNPQTGDVVAGYCRNNQTGDYAGVSCHDGCTETTGTGTCQKK